jgi:hypothetical protein
MVELERVKLDQQGRVSGVQIANPLDRLGLQEPKQFHHIPMNVRPMKFRPVKFRPMKFGPMKFRIDRLPKGDE